MVVLDVLQTKIEDSARENKILRTELDILKKEMEGEAVMFNMKVTEFQNQFYRVEQEIRSKNAEIERLRTNDCNRCTFLNLLFNSTIAFNYNCLHDTEVLRPRL